MGSCIEFVDLNKLGVEKYESSGSGYICGGGCPLSIYAERGTPMVMCRPSCQTVAVGECLKRQFSSFSLKEHIFRGQNFIVLLFSGL